MESTPYEEESVLRRIDALRDEGYPCEFIVRAGGRVACPGQGLEVPADALRVDRVERFEGVSDPDDMSILVAGTLGEGGPRGTLVLGFGPMASPEHNEILDRLQDLRPQE